MDKELNVSSGDSFAGMLFIVFLVLKLVGVINWSWWWVTAPLWGPMAIVLAILGIAIVICIVCAILVGVFK